MFPALRFVCLWLNLLTGATAGTCTGSDCLRRGGCVHPHASNAQASQLSYTPPLLQLALFARCLQWIYNAAKLKEVLTTNGDRTADPEFFDPPSCPFYTNTVGALSPYGQVRLERLFR